MHAQIFRVSLAFHIIFHIPGHQNRFWQVLQGTDELTADLRQEVGTVLARL